MVIAVTGASGQLGQALRHISGNYPEMEFHFADAVKADITDKDSIAAFFNGVQPDFCINAAAYTAVDKAESEPEKAYRINVTGAENLAMACRDFDVTLLHVSTDFVFDGTKTTPYTEADETHPQGVYGETKREGEKAIQGILEKYYIIRTSWLYSGFGNNFMKTMLRLAKERPSISVVDDQVGTPTNAMDLAEALIEIILHQDRTPEPEAKALFGTYHYSNEGEASWYDFAKKIFEVNKITIDVQPIPTSDYPTPAKRPAYSVLSKDKITGTFGIAVKHWAEQINR